MEPTLPSTPRREAYLALVNASEALVSQFKRLFQDHGLTLTQFNLLRLLVKGDPAGQPCGHLRDQMLHRVPDITRLVSRMEREGLLERHRSREDRRVVVVRITPEGRNRCEALYPAVQQLHEQQFPTLSEPELETLRELLRRAGND